jgi:hypothetical protein
MADPIYFDRPWTTEPGTVTMRAAVHDFYGGSRQSGISPSSATPNVMIFSDPYVGEKYGYRFDGWHSDGTSGLVTRVSPPCLVGRASR